MALARRRFATIACRRLFRRIKTRRTVCKSFDGPTCGGSEVSPPLPVDRVTLQRSFHRNRQQRIKTTFISPDSTATTRQSAIFDSLLFPFLLFFSVSVFFRIVSCISFYFSFVIISVSAFHIILVFSCVLGWGECRRHLNSNFPSSTHVIFQMLSFSHT